MYIRYYYSLLLNHIKYTIYKIFYCKLTEYNIFNVEKFISIGNYNDFEMGKNSKLFNLT